jgi:hypothetical protein
MITVYLVEPPRWPRAQTTLRKSSGRRPPRAAAARAAPVVAHSGDRLLSEPVAGTQPCRRERVFMPLPAVRNIRRDRLSWVDSRPSPCDSQTKRLRRRRRHCAGQVATVRRMSVPSNLKMSSLHLCGRLDGCGGSRFSGRRRSGDEAPEPPERCADQRWNIALRRRECGIGIGN